MRTTAIRKLLQIVLTGAAIAVTGTAWAAIDVEGFAFEDTETVANTKLVRNGASASKILSAKATVVGLYMTQRQTTAEAALAQKGPKRLRMLPLREISAKDLANVLLDRIRQNATREEVENNVLQLAALGSAFVKTPKLVKGDVLTLDYLPASQTTEIRLNGTLLTEPIMGEAFYPVLMKIWIGPKVTAATRATLLGGSEQAR